jgi:hypothetical protein
MGRRIVAILAGFVVANIVIFALEALGHAIYPPPAGLDLTKPEAFRTMVSQMPPGAFVLLVIGWLAGTAAGVATAQRINRKPTFVPGLVVGTMLFAATAYNFSIIPHPIWVVVAALVGIPVVTGLVARTATPGLPPVTPATPDAPR